MWLGIAKAVEQHSAENFARKEKEKEFEFRRQETLEDREFRREIVREEARLRQEELLTQLRIKKAAAGLDSDNNVGYVTAVSDLVRDAEGSDQFIETLKNNPGAAEDVLDIIKERQESRRIPLTAQEIVDGVRVAVTEEGSSVISTIPEFESEAERIMYELEIAGRGSKPVVYAAPSLYDSPDKADVEMAEQAFTVRLIDVATQQLESLGDNAGGSELYSTITNARKGDEFAMQKLRDQFGVQVAGEFIELTSSQPELRPIVQSPVYGQYIRDFIELSQQEITEQPTETPTEYTSTDQYRKDLEEVKELYRQGALTDQQVERLRYMYPGEFD